MMSSLRGRLFIGLTITVAVMGASAGLFVFRYAFDEAIEGQDAVLTQVAALAVEGRFDRHMTPSPGVDADNRLVIEDLPPRSDNTFSGALSSTSDDGLRDVWRGRERWRVVIRTRTDGSRVMVGQPTSVREEIATGSALHTLIPLAILIPVMLAVIAIIVRQSLLPMRVLADKLDARRAEDLDELPSDRAPRELQPFIASINRLLRRIRATVDQQRRFVADAAHELRTPIAALMLQAENLDQVALPRDSSERLAALKRGTKRTKHLLEQLLALAHQDSRHAGTMTVSSLDQCARNVVADLLPGAAEKGIDLGFTQLEPCRIAAESLTIDMLIRNLLDNAVRHTPGGGKIDVAVRADEVGAVLTIEDTGSGIPDEDIDRIFEPFFRGSRPFGEGSGLGLSIVRRIVDRLNGSVTLQNVGFAPATGLRVIVRLPAVGSQGPSVRV